jgi:MYXO-CTERM domain-containing protein
MKLSATLFSAAALAVLAGSSVSAHGALALALTGPTTQNYANGGGSGFGGVLGPATISFGSSGGNLDIGTSASSAALGGNIIVIMLDTRNGGIGDFEMNDTADGGRRAVSSPALNGFLNGPAGMTTYSAGSGGGIADFGLAIGSFGSVLFELVGGTNLNFVAFNAAQNISVPLAALGAPGTDDWYAYYTSDSQFLSNESLPASAAYNAGPNPGFTPGTYAVDNFNRFSVPAPGAAALLTLGTLAAARRRRN